MGNFVYKCTHTDKYTQKYNFIYTMMTVLAFGLAAIVIGSDS